MCHLVANFCIKSNFGFFSLQTQTELRRTQAELRLNQGDYERSHVELEQMQEKVLAFHKFLDKVIGSLQRLRN